MEPVFDEDTSLNQVTLILRTIGSAEKSANVHLTKIQEGFINGR